MEQQALLTNLMKAYDHSYTQNTFYDRLPYERDYDRCNARPMGMISGNIIKFYRYKIEEEPAKIDSGAIVVDAVELE